MESIALEPGSAEAAHPKWAPLNAQNGVLVDESPPNNGPSAQPKQPGPAEVAEKVLSPQKGLSGDAQLGARASTQGASLSLEPGPAEVAHPRQWVPPPPQEGIPLDARREWLRDEPLTFLQLFRRHVAADPSKTAATWLSVSGKVERQFTYQEVRYCTVMYGIVRCCALLNCTMIYCSVQHCTVV